MRSSQQITAMLQVLMELTPRLIKSEAQVAEPAFRQFGNQKEDWDQYLQQLLQHFAAYNIQGEFEDVYNALKAASEVENFTVYKRDELFERWHYRNDRTPPLLLLADEGFAFDDLYDPDRQKRNASRTIGVHGYDNELKTMHSFFIALGPLLKKNYTIPPFDSVDLYSLFCKILGLYSPPTNGSLLNVISMLTDDTKIKIQLKWIPFAGSVFLLVCLSIFAVHLMQQARRLKENNSDYTLLREASEGWKTNTQQECHQEDIQHLIQSEEE